MKNLQFIHDKFDLLFDNPEAVEAFKKLVLEMAVRGKLVPQDPNDEPASVMLKKIKEEKAKLIEEGKIKREKPLPPIEEDEKPYELPEGWEWVRLGEITIINPRNYLDDDLLVSFIPMKLIDQGYISSHSCEIKKWAEVKNGFTHFQEDDIVIAKITPCFQNRKSAILKNLHNLYGAGTTELHVIRPYNYYIDSQYILFFVKTNSFIKDGVKTFTGTAGQQRIKKEFISNSLIPLPPQSEQIRIVKKIYEIFNMLPKLSDTLNRRSEYNRQLNKVTLNKITTAPNDEELKSSMQFLLSNFDTLYINRENVSELRQAILSLAVQGKLVPQDPNDEPASVLLEQIKAEKEKLIEKGKIKREKPLPPIEEDEKPYELPQSWEWAKLEDICWRITDGTHYTPNYVSNGVPFLSVKDISQGFINFNNCRYITSEDHLQLAKRCNPEYGDILLTKVGTTGIAKVVDTKKEFSIFVSVALLKILTFCVYNYYIENVINSPLAREQSKKNTQGIGNKNLVIKHIKKMIIPVPPFNEQKRIVKKVDDLMTLCDELENNIEKSEHNIETLLQSLLHEAFNHAS